MCKNRFYKKQLKVSNFYIKNKASKTQFINLDDKTLLI